MSPLLLLVLSGCTWELLNEPCDTGREVQLASDPLWVASSTLWQAPVVGTEFVCGLERAEGDTDRLAPPDALTCFGPAAERVLPSTPTGLENIERLYGGGGILCAMAEDTTDPGVQDFRCWGDGADAALAGLDADLAAHEPSNVLALSVAEELVCGLLDLTELADPTTQIPRASCHGAGPVPAATLEDRIRGAKFTQIEATATMACGRTDPEGADPVEFRCWGEVPVELEAIEQSACWSTFDVTDGVLCATGVRTDDGPCAGWPQVACWGPADHPIVSGFDAVEAEIDARPRAPVQLHLGEDFACGYYPAESAQDADDPLEDNFLCWGADEGALPATPAGSTWDRLTTAPRAGHACALDVADTLPDAGPALTGRLTCWGDDQGGALQME